MAPPRRILRQQLEILMDFLEENKEMSKGLPSGTTISQQAIRQKWIAVAKRLNAVESGALKTPEGWKMVIYQITLPLLILFHSRILKNTQIITIEKHAKICI